MWGRGLTFAVEKEDDVFAKGLVDGSVAGEDSDDFVGERGAGDWVGPGVVSGDHVLFVEYKLMDIFVILGLALGSRDNSPELV